ncbi:serine/threonine protein kinase [Nocardioides scoriae]|uniref:non-specific serine/threonine protein kinase n=1 Tax=Nocardioides scoriae TaxID=642780 RepID=A0A1H1VQ48_9ACTN|nr:protein kinase [Nocardioides scoriae]SDS86189.1 serine/threonine protein kinase [Nocardioides scoriae]
MTAAAPERYTRRRLIASGGMGEVWEARDTLLGRDVAVKVLRRELADDAGFRARFSAEARHAAGLQHPGIAAVYDVGVPTDGQPPYLVMELVDGRPLSDLLAGDRALDPEQTRRLALQVARALGVAHRAGVVHRDVKPANLLVMPTGQVKITDFGIARAAGDASLTQTGQIVGSPHYLSPEQARGEASTPASDVYALGVVLFECLSGRRPFGAETAVATALAHLRDEVPPLPDGLPEDLVRITRRALAKDPAERYPDGDALAEALDGRDDATVAAPVPPADATRVLPAATRVAPAVPAATRVAPAAAAGLSGSGARGARPSAALLVGLLLGAAVVVGLLVARPWEDADTAGTPAERSPGPTSRTSATSDPTPTEAASPADTPSQTPEPSPDSSPESTPTDTPSEAAPSDVVPSDAVPTDALPPGQQKKADKTDDPGARDSGPKGD